MKSLITRPLIKINEPKYVIFIILFMPFLNFLNGISIDLYTPSMPAMAKTLAVSIAMIKNTVTATVLGWAIGALFFGTIIDCHGRKKALFIGLVLFTLTSGFIAISHNISLLYLLRFFQGASTTAIAIGCRAVLLDKLNQRQFYKALIYVTIGYGMGPIIGPFVGSLIQHHWGWRANFVTLFIIGVLSCGIIVIFIEETIPKKTRINTSMIAAHFTRVLKNKDFIHGMIILCALQLQILFYPTCGPFLVENVLGHSVLTFGHTALIVGAGYMTGSFTSRIILEYHSPKISCYCGYACLLCSVLVAFTLDLIYPLNLITLIAPLLLSTISAGLIFSNIVARNIQLEPEQAGMNMAIQVTLLGLIAGAGMFVISHIHVTSLNQIAMILLTLSMINLYFFAHYQKKFET